jgi:translin
VKLLTTIRAVLREAKKELTQKDKIREESHASMRKATSLSKHSILLVHQKRLAEAKKLLGDAEKIITDLQAESKEYPDIIFGGMFSAALQEYSEANIFLKLVDESIFVSPKEINVPSVDYVLGLADVVGEYRRLALDNLREGLVEKAEKCLKLMDEIYIELMAIDEAYMLVPGLRRKCDVARRIIETTRGDITQEVRRKSLEDYLKRFEQNQNRRRPSKKLPL